MNDNFNNEIDETTRQVGEQIGRKAGKIAGKTGRNVGKKALRLGTKLAKATGKALLATLKAILPYIAVPLLVIGVVLLSYFIVFEFIGTEKEYTKEYENEVERREDGIYYVTKDGMRGENQIIQDYYKYISGQSYSKSVGDSPEVYRPDDEEVEGVVDYYKREDEFNLAPNLLYALDEHLYNWKFKYSEQFIKPVAYDKETFDLLPLINERGDVIVKSDEEDVETGEKTGEEIYSVRDYGLGSVLKYNIDPDVKYERVEKIMGQYVAKDIWDGEKVVRVEIEPYDFVVELEKEDIYLIDKATLFTGNISYEYTKQDLAIGLLATGVGESETDKKTEILYDTYEEKHYEAQLIKNEETGEFEWEEVHVSSTFHPLVKYRSDDTQIFENVPVVTNQTVENDDLDYFESYLKNFEAYIPEDVITGFDFDKRIDYDSHVFDYDGFLVDDYGFDIGSQSKSSKAEYAKQYLPLIMEHSKDFGVDPYIVLAMMTQESGGKSTPGGDGIMQIDGGTREITATDIYGNRETIIITQAEKTGDVSKAIRWGVMFFKNLMDEMDGNPYKAIQAYNFGGAGMRTIQKLNPEAWESDYGWLIYREASRRIHAPAGRASANYDCMAFPEGTMPIVPGKLYGNSCHLEMVLQYYSGGELASVETTGSNSWDKVVNAGKQLGKKFLDFIIPRKKDDLIPKFEHSNYLSHSRITDVLGTTKALNEDVLFSFAVSNDASTLNFWDEGYMESLQSVGLSLQELMDIAPNPDGYLPPINMTGRSISSYFGWRIHPIEKIKKFHNGVDIPAPTGTPVYAVADGEVTHASFSGTATTGAGNLLIIKHDNGTESVYMHLSGFGVVKGARVSQGDEVGKVGTTGGSTGPHLHYGFKVNGNYVDGLGIILGN